MVVDPGYNDLISRQQLPGNSPRKWLLGIHVTEPNTNRSVLGLQHKRNMPALRQTEALLTDRHCESLKEPLRL